MFSRVLASSKTAFLVCDLQTAFQHHIHQFGAVVATSNKLIRAANASLLLSRQILDIPVLVTEHHPRALGNTVPAIDISSAKLVQSKSLFSMVVPQIEEALQGIESAVLFGIEAHVCILQTALDLRSRGVHVFVVADGVSSCNRQEVPLALERMRQHGCVVASSESILFQLMKDALHPSFKQISALIKETKQDTKDALNALL
ncbi:Isochorismatase domain-containing protein 1 [Kappamyces sp. JEL0829]|nr:Isochorismatase domain-containing protein 1 [Kappamyces sp. JEL0829]